MKKSPVNTQATGRKNKKPEAVIEAEIYKHLNSIGWSVDFYESSTFGIYPEYQDYKVKPRHSDIAGCMPGGIACYIEVKNKGKRSTLTDTQREFLVEKIKETDWKNVSVIHDGPGSDHLYLYKINKKNGQPLCIAWWDYFDEKKANKTKSITIDVGNIESVKVTETIPNAEWGKDLKESNYPSFFKTEVKKAIPLS